MGGRANSHQVQRVTSTCTVAHGAACGLDVSRPGGGEEAGSTPLHLSPREVLARPQKPAAAAPDGAYDEQRAPHVRRPRCKHHTAVSEAASAALHECPFHGQAASAIVEQPIHGGSKPGRRASVAGRGCRRRGCGASTSPLMGRRRRCPLQRPSLTATQLPVAVAAGRFATAVCRRQRGTEAPRWTAPDVDNAIRGARRKRW